MNNKFQREYFQNEDLSDCFFDSLKSDYAEFELWFGKKAENKEQAFIYREDGIKAFLYLKKEYGDDCEEIELDTQVIPAESRIKIGTLKLLDTVQGMRLGEGAIGMALWFWQKEPVNEIYVTVFEKHAKLINILENFGFVCRGNNRRGERVYFKDKRSLDTDSAYKLFPYIDVNFEKCGYIPIEDHFHDTLFPYSELKNTEQESEEIAAANGITKVFIATPSSKIDYESKDPVLIYRIHTGDGKKSFKSVVTSFCTIVKTIEVKQWGRSIISFDDFIKCVGNKSVYSKDELEYIYKEKKTIYVLVMVYNGYLGSGNNITYRALKDKGYFEGYPYLVKLNEAEFKDILRMGGKDVHNIVIN